MSVYIKIKEAQLAEPATKPFLIISSKDNTLKTEAVSGGNTVTWNTCMISSSKQKNIVFQIKEGNQTKSYGKGQLYYSSLRSHPEKQFSQTITFDSGAKLLIDVYYTQRQNFIGEIAFYSYQNYVSKGIEETTGIQETTKAESRGLQYAAPLKATSKPKSNNLFFCCGDEGDDKLFTVQQDVGPITARSPAFSKELPNKKATQGVQFYKGPCKSTNLFSCCDAGIQDQKFTVVENYYRDK